jgi:type IV pilus assembly protein PilM
VNANFKYRYPIGIDIGNQNIYAVQLKETRQGLAIRGMVHRPLNDGAEGVGILEAGDALFSGLEGITKNKGFSGKRVVVNFPSQYTYTFPISFHLQKEESLEEAILRETKEYLSFPVEEAAIDYPSIVSLSDEADKYKAYIIAARKDHIQKYLLILKRAGLIVEAVDESISPLIRLHHYLYELNENQMILCNIGSTQTLFSIVTKHRVLIQRMVAWGVQALIRKLQENLELLGDQDRAKILLKTYGLTYEGRGGSNTEKDFNDNVLDENLARTIFQIIAPYIGELIYEFHNIIGYVMSEEHNAMLQGISIYGQANLVHNLDRYLERHLNISTRLINPIKDVALLDGSILPDISQGAPFALALALAMRKVTWL